MSAVGQFAMLAIRGAAGKGRLTTTATFCAEEGEAQVRTLDACSAWRFMACWILPRCDGPGGLPAVCARKVPGRAKQQRLQALRGQPLCQRDRDDEMPRLRDRHGGGRPRIGILLFVRGGRVWRARSGLHQVRRGPLPTGRCVVGPLVRSVPERILPRRNGPGGLPAVRARKVPGRAKQQRLQALRGQPLY